MQIRCGRRAIVAAESEPEPAPVTEPETGVCSTQRVGQSGRRSGMAFDHEQLDVYRLGLEFLVLAERVIQSLPKGRSHLADQLTRASISIVLNVAEGAGKFSKGDKRRYYLAARGSATESAALLDVYLRLELTSEVDHGAGKQMLERIVAMLVKLARSFEGR